MWTCSMTDYRIKETILHKRHNLGGGGKLLNTECVFWFSLQLLSETFLTVIRIQWDIIINVHASSCKDPVILVIF
jgi:hypothetical protein